MTKDDKSAGRPRSGPTIDLKAKEISSAPATGADKPNTKDSGKSAHAGTAQSKPQDLPPSPPPLGGPRRSPVWLMPLVFAVGAGLPLFGFGWWFGNYASEGARTATPAAASPEIVARLDKIEAALAKPPAADPALRAVADNVAGIGRRLDEVALAAREARTRADAASSAAEAAQKTARASPPGIVAQADIEALSKRISTLEQATTNKDSALADRISGEAEDQAGRRAVAASALRHAVERGEPYVAELAAAKALSSNDGALAPLDIFAAGGIPSERMLARELSSLAQSMIKLAGEPRPSGVLEKLQASAERLIRIRPVGDIPGDDPAAVISRIELKAARTDIEGALHELAKLPPAVRAPAEDWIKKARAREAAATAARQFAREALAALGKPGL